MKIHILFTLATVAVVWFCSEGETIVVTAPEPPCENRYVQSVKPNGELLDKTFIRPEDIISGGILEFGMGPTPNKQGGIKNTTK